MAPTRTGAEHEAHHTAEPAMTSLFLTACLARIAGRPVSSAAVARARCAARTDADADENTPCGGCFDSSHELSQGLAITEHGELDAGAVEQAALGCAH
ncbi:hypothetical protein [Methylibium sp.]|uniref:hypothetical protein n=2 Tax=Methylibium sp. TaxID=2067992 RepID=UPI00286D441C|nr:hypothetical protein [Methylibium sp.]